ncbi:unnamed protein product [Prunus armeniaca]
MRYLAPNLSKRSTFTLTKMLSCGNGACYILFKDFMSPLVYHEKDMDLEVLKKLVEDLYVQDDGNFKSLNNLKITWLKQSEIIKEPYFCSLRNLLLYFPGISSLCITDLLRYNFICPVEHYRSFVTSFLEYIKIKKLFLKLLRT